MPGASDQALFNLDSATGYTVTNVPNNTSNQSLSVEQDKVKLDLTGRTYVLTDVNALNVAVPDGTTGTLEVVGGMISVNQRSFAVGGGWFGSGTQHGTLIFDGTVVGVAERVDVFRIGSLEHGRGDVTIRGGAKFMTGRGIDRLQLLNNTNTVTITGVGTQVKAARFNMGSPYTSPNPTLNTVTVSDGAYLEAAVWDSWVGRFAPGSLTVTGTGTETRFSGVATTLEIGKDSGGYGLIEVLDGAYFRFGTGDTKASFSAREATPAGRCGSQAAIPASRLKTARNRFDSAPTAAPWWYAMADGSPKRRARS